MKQYGTDPELDKLVDSNFYGDRVKAAKHSYGLDILVNDAYSSIRELVANQGYGLDKLIYDKAYEVRAAVADQGYGLDKLVNDKDWQVRVAVAKQGYGLDILINDEHYFVRAAVARQGYGLDKLIHDKYYLVRADVAKQGYGLDKLINDIDKHVREAVAKQGYGLDILINDEHYEVRVAVAEQGYGLDKLINDTHSYVRDAVNDYLRDHNYKSVFDWAKDNNVDIDIDEWLNSDDVIKRIQVAKAGYRLDILINDKDWEVRDAVAWQGYGLDVLVLDKNHWVREAVEDYLKDHNYRSVIDWAKDNNVDLNIDDWLHSNNFRKRIEVAKAGYRLDILIYDEDWRVYEAIDDYLIDHNYKTVFDWANDNSVDIDIDKFLHSGNWIKRREVARQGYNLDVLILDDNEYVREAVEKYLKNHSYKTVFDWAKDNGVDIDSDKWIKSDNHAIRLEAARAGYGLNKLIHDESAWVRVSVEKYLEEHNYKTIFDWFVDNIPESDYDQLLYSSYTSDRCLVARRGYGLDILVYDEDATVRKIVAEQGYGLEKLVYDEDKDVRKAVAEQGYGLNKLMFDDDNEVRHELHKYLREHNYKSVFEWAKDNNVTIDLDKWINSDDVKKRYKLAKLGYGLDVLVHDKDGEVRAAVAKHGYGLDILVNDDDEYVRAAVARQGYGLDKLVNDDEYVYEVVYDYLGDHNYESVFDWAKDNNIDIDIDEWLHSDNWTKRREVARAGYGLDILSKDKNSNVSYAVKTYLKKHKYKTLKAWRIANSNIANTKQEDLSDTISTFINKIENSSMLAVQTNLDSIDDFISSDASKIDIVTIDTKISIITITKLKKDEYKFDFNVNDNISSTFTSTEVFNKLMNLAINALKEDNTYYKYAEDLEQCV